MIFAKEIGPRIDQHRDHSEMAFPSSNMERSTSQLKTISGRSSERRERERQRESSRTHIILSVKRSPSGQQQRHDMLMTFNTSQVEGSLLILKAI
jgi:hypothetical protein